MLDDESTVITAPGVSRSDTQIHWAKQEWDKGERSFRQSVALLCGIIESESRNFTAEKMEPIAAEFRACFARQRASNRRDFAQSLQDLLNTRHATLLADWQRELAIPAAGYVQEATSRFNASTDEIIRRVKGLPAISPEPQAGGTEISLLPAEGRLAQRVTPVRASWFRKRMLRQAAWQLRIGVESSIGALSRKLIEQIQQRSVGVRDRLHHRLNQAFADASEFPAGNFQPLAIEDRDNTPVLFAAEQTASQGAVLLPFGWAVAPLPVLRCGSSQAIGGGRRR